MTVVEARGTGPEGRLGAVSEGRLDEVTEGRFACVSEGKLDCASDGKLDCVSEAVTGSAVFGTVMVMVVGILTVTVPADSTGSERAVCDASGGTMVVIVVDMRSVTVSPAAIEGLLVGEPGMAAQFLNSSSVFIAQSPSWSQSR